MNKRILLVGLLSAVAMFLWTSIAHMVLPLGEAGIRQIDNEQALLSQMSSTLKAPGLYFFPKMEPGTDEAQYQQLVASGPSGILIYFPKRDFAFSQSLAIEFGAELALTLLAAYLLSLTRLSTFAGRLGFYALIGLIAAISTNISYWNWYGFPTLYTSAVMFTGWMGFLCAGLVAAAMKVGGTMPPAPAA